MLVQTKLFTPPPMTEEAKMQQKMMKYMMIFMAFMFYKVPSGLGIYFITSSLWQIGERLLLPKLAKPKKAARRAADDFGRTATAEAAVEPRPPDASRPAAPTAGSKKLEKLLEEADNERTIRNNGEPTAPAATAATARTATEPAPTGTGPRRGRPRKRR